MPGVGGTSPQSGHAARSAPTAFDHPNRLLFAPHSVASEFSEFGKQLVEGEVFWLSLPQ